MARGVEEEEEGLFSALARGSGWYAAASRMPQSWTTGGLVYAQDDYPQCAIYLESGVPQGARADADGVGVQGEGERSSLPATSSRSPLLPFAFTIAASEVSSSRSGGQGSEEGGYDEAGACRNELDGAGDSNEEALQVVEWQRDDPRPRQACARGVTLHLTRP